MFRFFLSCILVFLLFSSGTTAQQSENKFIYGVYLDKMDSTNQTVYDYVDSMKMNTVVAYANYNNSILWENYLSKYNVIAGKSDSPEDFINYYSSGYYTKWEAEEVTGNYYGTGFRANYGGSTVYHNRDCWTTGSETSHSGELMLRGPYYRQDKNYKLLYNQLPINYTLRIEVAKTNLIPYNPLPGDSICKIAVVFTYLDGGDSISIPLNSITLYDTSISSDSFKTFSIDYIYPERFRPIIGKTTFMTSENLFDFNDSENGTGIEFQVTWYGKRQIFIDYFEVYDNEIGNYIAGNEGRVKSNITQKISQYNSWSGDSIKYFFTISEPQTIDNYTPMRIVEEALRDNGKIGISEFYPQWSGNRNGDWTLAKYKNMVNPQRLNVEFISHGIDPQVFLELRQQHARLKESWESDSSFWYEAMIAAPYQSRDPWSEPCWTRYPSFAEMNSSLMNALAHGARGILIYELISDGPSNAPACTNVYWRELLDRTSNGIQPDSLYYYFRDYFGPRITGIFGKTLFDLEYENKFSTYIFEGGLNPTEDSYQGYMRFFKKDTPGIDDSYYFHAGLFKHKTNIDDNYFLALNALNNPGTITIRLTPSVSGFNNTRFRNIEGGLDTTFNQTFDYDVTFPAGEGYLFQVSPVIKYGGKLIYSETISSAATLTDNLTIYSGDTLTVSSTYNLYDTLIINSGGHLVISSGGKINIYNGGAIINNGSITANNAELRFSEGVCLRNDAELNANGSLFSSISNSWGGIYFSRNSTGTIDSCTIENVTSGSALITVTTASPIIKNSFLQNCHSGIIILEGSEAGVYNNTIFDVSANGIYIENSSPIIGKNFIHGSTQSRYNAAVKCNYFASPIFINLESPEGLNTLQGGYYGVYAYDNSTVYMGDEGETAHLNRIFNITNYAYAGDNSVIYALNNWWGTDNPDDSGFTAIEESFIF